jgi:hypothetical protein
LLFEKCLENLTIDVKVLLWGIELI